MFFRIISNKDLFIFAEDLDNLLTQSEKQRIIKHEMDFIRALEGDTHVPGAPKVEFYKDEAISMYKNSKLKAAKPLANVSVGP